MKENVIKEFLQAKLLKAAAQDVYDQAEQKVIDELCESGQSESNNSGDTDDS